MNLDQRVDLIWAEAYAGCDPAIIEANPRAYSREWVKVGYMAGLLAGQKILTEVVTHKERDQRAIDREMGFAQGIAKAAFIASHCPLNLAPIPLENEASLMAAVLAAREIIVAAIAEAQLHSKEQDGKPAVP